MSRYRFTMLLVFLILYLAATPVIPYLVPRHSVLGSTAFTCLFAAVLLSAVYAVSRSAATMVAGLCLAIPTILLDVLDVSLDMPGLSMFHQASGAVFLAYAMVLIVLFVFRSTRVTHDVINASLCVYILAGVFWAAIYYITETLDPGAFTGIDSTARAAGLAEAHGGPEGGMLYLSFVTLTTLGYGDVVPVTMPARMLVVVNALMGQLFLVVLVARLVGMHVAQAGMSEGRERSASDKD